jgi:hypothetical protein
MAIHRAVAGTVAQRCALLPPFAASLLRGEEKGRARCPTLAGAPHLATQERVHSCALSARGMFVASVWLGISTEALGAGLSQTGPHGLPQGVAWMQNPARTVEWMLPWWRWGRGVRCPQRANAFCAGTECCGCAPAACRLHLLTKHRVFSGPGFQVAQEVGDAASGGQVLLTHDSWLQLRGAMDQAGFPTVEQLGLFKLESWPTPMWLYQVSCLPACLPDF